MPSQFGYPQGAINTANATSIGGVTVQITNPQDGQSLTYVAADGKLENAFPRLNRPASFFQRFFDPPAQVYPLGITVLATWLPTATFLGIMPITVTLPGIPGGGQLEYTGFRFTYSDASTSIFQNTQNVYQTSDMNVFPTPDGLYVTQIEFIANALQGGHNYDLDVGFVLGFQV